MTFGQKSLGQMTIRLKCSVLLCMLYSMALVDEDHYRLIINSNNHFRPNVIWPYENLPKMFRNILSVLGNFREQIQDIVTGLYITIITFGRKSFGQMTKNVQCYSVYFAAWQQLNLQETNLFLVSFRFKRLQAPSTYNVQL